MSISAATMMHATPLTPIDTPVMIRKRELAVAITLVVVDATIAVRTEAQALAYQGLKPSAAHRQRRLPTKVLTTNQHLEIL